MSPPDESVSPLQGRRVSMSSPVAAAEERARQDKKQDQWLWLLLPMMLMTAALRQKRAKLGMHRSMVAMAMMMATTANKKMMMTGMMLFTMATRVMLKMVRPRKSDQILRLPPRPRLCGRFSVMVVHQTVQEFAEKQIQTSSKGTFSRVECKHWQ
jgi:hypothetical protein